MQKRKTFRPWQPEQTTLLPPSPREWLSEDHQVYFLLDLVDELDLSEILIPALAKDPRGEKGFDPRMMTMLLLYAYCVGIVSSRKIERACYEDLAFRVLTGNQQPDHSRISEFRRRNLDALKVPGVNYVGGSRQLRRRVGAPLPLPWQGERPRLVSERLAGN
jgi:transposase